MCEECEDGEHGDGEGADSQATLHVRARSVGMLNLSYVEFMHFTHHPQDPFKMSMSSVSFSHESSTSLKSEMT